MPTWQHIAGFPAARRASTAILLVACAACAFASAHGSDDALCLPDRNADGHPVFGNLAVRTLPEFGTIKAPISSVTNPNIVAFGDLDSDGDPDAFVAYSNWFNGNLGLISVHLGDGDGGFELHEMLQAGVDATHAALADLDADGDLDAAVVCAIGDERVFIYWNHGLANFSLPTTLTVGQEPTCVRAVDVDCDGDPDLLTLNAGSDDVSLLRNNGNGTFAPEQRFAVGSVPSHAVFEEEPGPHFGVGDLDLDGDADLAVPSDNRVFLLLNDGAGQFTPAAKHLQTDAFTYVVAIGELNNDGRPDVVASAMSPQPFPRSLSVYLNTSEAGCDPPKLRFAPPAHYPVLAGVLPAEIVALDLGDVTGDGLADIAAMPWFGYQHVSLYVNRGDGTFIVPSLAQRTQGYVPFLLFTTFAALADVNGDGRLDLTVLSRWVRQTMRTVLNDGSGRLLSDGRWPRGAEMCVGACVQGLTDLDVGDIDRDGDVDIVVSDSDVEDPFHVRVYFNDGNGNFGKTDEYVLQPSEGTTGDHVRLGDLNGDGALDVVIADSEYKTSPAIWTMMNRGDGTFEPGVKYPLADYGPRQFEMGDLDGDGDLDLAIWAMQVGRAGEMLDRRVLIMTNDGRGHLELAGQVSYASAPWFGIGGIALGDVDGDRDLDVVVGATSPTTPSTLALLYNDGAGSFSVAWQTETARGLGFVRLADLEGDGDLDCFTAAAPAFNDDDVYAWVWRNDGGKFEKAFDLHDPQLKGDHVVGLTLDDIDANGVLDVVFCTGVGTMAVHLDFLRTPAPQHYATDSWPAAPRVADFDGDGRMDVAAIIELYDHMAILLNRACPPTRDPRPDSP